MVRLVLRLVCVLCLAVLVKGPFLDGVYSWYIRQPEFWSMIGETAGLALILGVVWLFAGNRQAEIVMTGILCLVFAWCHVVLLPMVVSGGYLAYLYLVGYLIRTRCTGVTDDEMNDGWLWDILLGFGVVIILFCLISVMGVGRTGVLKVVVAVMGIGVCVCVGPEVVRKL